MIKDNLKLIIYSKDHIIIKNHQKLKDIKDDIIEVDCYQIIGKFLKISVLDEELIELYGQIKEIKIVDY